MGEFNQYLSERLTGIGYCLMGAHQAGRHLSSATKGTEREAFIRLFLEEVFTPSFRFGHGDITDSVGQISGQCDIVVEYPFVPSVPVPGGGARLYLAEGVAAVIEVKSNLLAQWDEVVATAKKIKELTRNINPLVTVGVAETSKIPVFAVGYTGWKTMESIAGKLDGSEVDGAFIIDSALFVANSNFFGGVRASGPVAMWLLMATLQEAMSTVKLADPSLLAYAKPDRQ